jgi:hypothetical protein
MLPEFPKLTAAFDTAITLHMRSVARRYESFMGEVPQHRLFEGSEMTMRRSDQSGETTNFFEAESKLEIPFEEMIAMSLEEVLKRFETNVEDLVSQKAKHFFQIISEGVDKVGNKIDAKGQPSSAPLYLDMLERNLARFPTRGVPKLPALVISPSAKEAAEKMQIELFSNPEYRERFKRILEMKREEWRAREADRELVG